MQEIIQIDLGAVNCYLIKNKEHFILVDTGGHITTDKVFDNRYEQLLSALEKYKVTPENLKLIVLTHGDNDHVCNVVRLKEKYAVKIAMHSGDLKLVQNPTLADFMETFRYRSVINKIMFGILHKMITRITKKTLDDFQCFKPDILLNDGDSLGEYGFDAIISSIPGHTNGSIGILTPSNELIAGDIFVNIKKPTASPNAVDFKELYKSIDRIKNLQVTTIFPGHGKPFPIASYK